MLARDASNGIDLTIAKLTTFYAFLMLLTLGPKACIKIC